jgi:hypothetical protein
MKRSNLFFNQKEKNTVACLLAKKASWGKHTSLFHGEKPCSGKHTSLLHEKKGLLGKNTLLFLA